MLEKVIEERLRDEVKRLGGVAFKFVSPGNDGVPDRLVCLPGGRIAFIELKAPGKKPTPLQIRQMGRLQELGQMAFVIDSIEAVDEYIRMEGGGRS
ncbi:MAG TPA: VRR-NUC domain-containing protein [Clostridia bacterium]|nr:VRR-NUC domain-containing protein [Clostridia bacterium]